MLLHFIMILCVFTFPFTMALGTLQGSDLKAMKQIAKPHCKSHCGNIPVPYPFGIGTDCSLDESFYVTCNSTHYDPPRLFIQSTNIEIYNISESELRYFTTVSYKCYKDVDDERISHSANLPGLFTFSGKNMLTVIGCDDLALISGTEEDDFIKGCVGLCSKAPQDVSDGQCSGKGCCQTSITEDLTAYNISIGSVLNHTIVSDFNPCGYAFLHEDRSFEFRGASDLADGLDFVNRTESTVHVVLDWVIANRSCSEATECKDNSSCYNVGGGYRCRCNQGFEGNPYLDQGCQDDGLMVAGIFL